MNSKVRNLVSPSPLLTPNFRYDIDIPMLLDYEIWKASHMLFQKFPYNEDDSLDHENGEEKGENLS